MSRYSRQVLVGISCLLMVCIAGTFARGDSTVVTNTITGTVTGVNGPASGVTVKVFAYHAKHTKGSSTSTTVKHQKPVSLGEATTDGNGTFSIAKLPPGEYIVTAVLKGVGKGHATTNLTGSTTVAVSITLKAHKGKSN